MAHRGLLGSGGGLLGYAPIPRVRRPNKGLLDAYGGDLNQIGKALIQGILRPMESAGKQIAGDAPVDPNKITDAALASMGLGYGVTGLVGGVPKGALGANVWHGGPNRWMPEPGYPQGRPLLSRVGTGEGAKAYGHGFYSAESKGVAQSYKENLGYKSPLEGFDARKYPDVELAENSARNWLLYAEGASDSDIAAMLKTAKPKTIEYDVLMGKITEGKGHLKKLDLPDEDIAKMLDWDAPLSEQPEGVKRLVGEMGLAPAQKGQLTKQINELEERLAGRGTKSFGSHVRDPLEKELRDLKTIRADATTGEELYKQIAADLGSEQAASEALRKAGIPGLKYYDQMSRPGLGGSDKIGFAVRYADGSRSRVFENKAQAETALAQHKKAGNSGGKVESVDEGTRNYVTWDQDVLNRTKILEDGQPKIFNNPNVRGRADDIAGALQAEFPGLRVEVNQGGSAAGKSAYIKLRYKPEGAKRVIDTEFRISDHSLGARRMQDYPVNENIGLGGETTTDLSDVFSKLKGAIARVDDTIK